MQVAISGAAYYAACDPNASSVPTQEKWPTPTRRRVGRGAQWVYPDQPGLAEDISSHLRQVGEGLLYGDAETRVEARACLAAANKIDRALAALSEN